MASVLAFDPFKNAIAAQFDLLTKHPMLRTSTPKDDLWSTYLGSFPAGTDPIYKERTEHDCNCCKSFVRAVGNAVAIINGQLVSVWDIRNTPLGAQVDEAYLIVADALSARVKADAIEDAFFHTEPVAGTDKSFVQLLDGSVTWKHFFVRLPGPLVVDGVRIGAALNGPRTLAQVMKRGLTELTMDAVLTAQELIAQGSVYRGEEHARILEQFKQLKAEYDLLGSDDEKTLFVWSRVVGNGPNKVHGALASIRNSAIGTFLIDLSADMDVQEAVDKFGRTMSPHNYKRPKAAAVTPKMLENLRKEVEDLGYLESLERRMAVLTDITVPNTLHVNRSTKAKLTGNVFEDLAAGLAQPTKSFDKVEEMTIEKFIADVLPKVDSIEVFLENRHDANLVSLVAPANPGAPSMFKWSNGFSWDYNGGLADSIRERVKAAGGNVEGDLCCRLAWFNRDDLDFHMFEPGMPGMRQGEHIYFGNKQSRSGGHLDVDMNVSAPVRDAVENIVYPNRSRMAEGVYKLAVHNYTRRETVDVGFEVEMDFLGTVYRFAYNEMVNANETITVAEFEYSHKDGLKLLKSLPTTTSVKSKTIWGLATQQFHPVNIMMFSPNHWDGEGIGNRHYFFMVEGCQNEGVVRGFYNEFLKAELDGHRKALELVGAKMPVAKSANQLSGLGFNSTTRNELVVRVKGAFSRTLKLKF